MNPFLPCNKNTLTIIITVLLLILFVTGNIQSTAKFSSATEVVVPG